MLTEDKDFGELVFRLKKPCHGIILIRIDVKERNTKWNRLKTLIEKYGVNPINCTQCDRVLDRINTPRG